LLAAAPSAADDYYKDKTISIIVGLAAGGTIDSLARQFAATWASHTPGNPTMIVKNMTGGGGMNATNYVYEAAAKDGLTIYFGTWFPLAQVLKTPGFRSPYENFHFLGGIADTRISYSRTDVIPGGLKKPADIAKVKELWIGGNAATGGAHLQSRIPLDVLGINYKQIVGYRGGSDMLLALERNEIQYTGTSIATFRTRNAEFIRSGKGMGLFYLAPAKADGSFTRNALITEVPTFQDLYQEIHGKMPSGPAWEALNWFSTVLGTMNYIALAPPGTPAAAIADLRTGFERLSRDPTLNADGQKRNGVPYEWVDRETGEHVINTLNADPGVVATFQRLLEAGAKPDKIVK
jgi:tripartite-type tricarboxylate transporter receptor subunit TctC